MKGPSEKTWRVFVSKETRKLILRRRLMFRRIGEPDIDLTVYKELWTRVQKSKKKDACEIRTRKTKAIAKMVEENRFEDWRY